MSTHQQSYFKVAVERRQVGHVIVAAASPNEALRLAEQAPESRYKWSGLPEDVTITASRAESTEPTWEALDFEGKKRVFAQQLGSAGIERVSGDYMFDEDDGAAIGAPSLHPAVSRPHNSPLWSDEEQELCIKVADKYITIDDAWEDLITAAVLEKICPNAELHEISGGGGATFWTGFKAAGSDERRCSGRRNQPSGPTLELSEAPVRISGGSITL